MMTFQQAMDELPLFDPKVHPIRRKSYPHTKEINHLSFQERFIIRSSWCHGKGKYDYSCIPHNFKSSDQFYITCPIHGKFLIDVDHARGARPCKECSKQQRLVYQDRIIEIVQEAGFVDHRDYDYSKTDFPVNPKQKLAITCKKHGEVFHQEVHNHKKASGCSQCKKERRQRPRSNTSDFVKRAKKIHGEKFNYNKSVYEGRHQKLIITCPDHGDFEQTAGNHLNGQECWYCRNEKISSTAKKTHKLNDENANDLCILYFVTFQCEGNRYEKIGITRRAKLTDRFASETNMRNIEVLCEYYSSYQNCYLLEKNILEKYKDKRFQCKELKGQMCGWTECFLTGAIDVKDIPLT